MRKDGRVRTKDGRLILPRSLTNPAMMSDDPAAVAKRARPHLKHVTPFKKGVSGNPGGLPKGIRHFEVLRMVSATFTEEIQARVIEALKAELFKEGRLIPSLEFAAKLNAELPPARRAELDLEGEGEVRIKLTWGEGE
jgi:hypothetical protein